MEKIDYHIDGLHCAEEIALLKKVVGTRSGIDELDFHLLSNRMTVLYDPEKIDSAQIISLVNSTGMTATLWEKRTNAISFWSRHGRLVLTCTSGLFLLIGIILQSLALHSFFNLFAIHEMHPEPLPAEAKLFYLLSLISSLWFIFPKSYASVRKKHLDMNVLIVVAAVGAIAINQWFEGASAAFLFSIALLLEHWSLWRAKKAISALLNLSPPLARVVTSEGILEKKVEEVEIGERILVRPGEKIPLDGVVLSGFSTVNQSPLTGEAMPIFKQSGDEVFAGTLNEDGALECKVTKLSNETALAHIINLVQEARGKRAHAEQWVEKFAKVYTPIVMVFALLVMLLCPLLLSQSFSIWIYRGLVLLVIACPCALVISTPVSIVAGLTSSARSGVLIKGGLFLELIGRIRALCLDKTGTMTRGHPQVQKIIPLNGHTEKELLHLAATLEQNSEHPIAKALLKRAKETHIKLSRVENFQSIKGLGAEGSIAGKSYWIGSHRFLHEKGQETETEHALALELEDAGHSVIAIGNETHICGLISVADSPKTHLRETIAALHNLGVAEIAMLTGDNFPTAKALAKESGVDSFFAELLPHEKLTIVEKLKQKHEKVAMVGDGVNDAPALAAATVGIAMGDIGSDAAFETADMVLMSDDLSLLPHLIRHSRRTTTIIQQNIAFSLALKAAFLLLAIFGLASLWMAIAADTGASLLVIFNGLRLLKF